MSSPERAQYLSEWATPVAINAEVNNREKQCRSLFRLRPFRALYRYYQALYVLLHLGKGDTLP